MVEARDVHLTPCIRATLSRIRRRHVDHMMGNSTIWSSSQGTSQAQDSASHEHTGIESQGHSDGDWRWLGGKTLVCISSLWRQRWPARLGDLKVTMSRTEVFGASGLTSGTHIPGEAGRHKIRQTGGRGSPPGL